MVKSPAEREAGAVVVFVLVLLSVFMLLEHTDAYFGYAVGFASVAAIAYEAGHSHADGQSRREAVREWYGRASDDEILEVLGDAVESDDPNA